MDGLYASETNEEVKKEYQAMRLDYQGAVINLDITKNIADILSDNLSEEEFESKMETNKVLIVQYLDTINKLETQYSDTYFFQNNYATEEGKELLQQVKKNYKEALEEI